MIIIGIIVCLIGLVLLILAWRGRVAARGQFCRKCRFDLAGLDLEFDDSKCPECGSSVSQIAQQRGYIRQSSRLGVAAAVILMLSGGGGIWAGAAGKSGAIIAAMPDGILLWMTDLGVDVALDELVVRVSRAPSTLSSESWDHAIEAGLAHQADTTISWDVRWGEVLYQGLILSRMSDEQLKQYFVNADEIKLTIRDRVHPGASGFGYMLEWEMTRYKMITGGFVDYQQDHRVMAYGVKGEEPIWTSGLDNRKARISLLFSPNGQPNIRGPWMRSTTWRMNDYFAHEPGNVVDVYFDYEMTIVPIGETEPIVRHTAREEFTIQIIDEDEPIVRTNNDEAAALFVMENLQIAPLKITRQILEPKPNHWTPILTTTFTASVPFDPLALEVFLLIDGQEILVGDIAHRYSERQFGSFLSWTFDPEDNEGLEAAARVHDRLIEEGTVTVIVRTNAALIKDIPGVEEVLGVDLMFEDVPIEILETSNKLNIPNRDGAQGGAVPVVD